VTALNVVEYADGGTGSTRNFRSRSTSNSLNGACALLPDADDTGVDAFSKIPNPQQGAACVVRVPPSQVGATLPISAAVEIKAALYGAAGRRQRPALCPGRRARHASGHIPHVTRLRLAPWQAADPGSAIFVSSRLSSLRPPRLVCPSEPSLRDGFASPDPRPLRELSPATNAGEIRRRNLAATMTCRSR
jgi:hypothetical protein